MSRHSLDSVLSRSFLKSLSFRPKYKNRKVRIEGIRLLKQRTKIRQTLASFTFGSSVTGSLLELEFVELYSNSSAKQWTSFLPFDCLFFDLWPNSSSWSSSFFCCRNDFGSRYFENRSILSCNSSFSLPNSSLILARKWFLLRKSLFSQEISWFARSNCAHFTRNSSNSFWRSGNSHNG